ncbi:MAG: SSU ribosomal protein S20p, partial [uncultured Gemmatimonadaceae bacterium]
AEHRLRKEEHAEVPRRPGAQPRSAFRSAHRPQEGQGRGRVGRSAYLRREPARSRRPQGADPQERRGPPEEPPRQARRRSRERL